MFSWKPYDIQPVFRTSNPHDTSRIAVYAKPCNVIHK